MKKQMLRDGLIILFFVFGNVALLAEPGDPDAGQDPPAPIDGWVFMLIVMGLMIAGYYLIRYRKMAYNGK